MRTLIQALLLFFTLITLSAPAFSITEDTQNMMVSVPSRHGVDTARRVANLGGNVVDVAVAVELTLAVTVPYYASLGGGGFAMIRMNGAQHALDFRETAPEATHSEYYKGRGKDASTVGPFAIAIPGIPAGIWALHEKYGKLKWSALFADAIRLADEGFPVSGEWTRITKDEFKNFNRSGKKYFAKENSYLNPGDTLKQPQLAAALKELRDKGADGFYKGSVAKDIIDTVNQIGGSLTPNDFANYRVRWLKPMVSTFKDHTVYMMPPPSSSGVITRALIQLAKNPIFQKSTAFGTSDYHLLAEILKISYRGRSTLGDPDFHKNPAFHLLSDAYLSPLSKQLNLKKRISLKPLDEKKIPKEHNETTNCAVMDKAGNAVVMTITLNGSYGSGVTSDKFGIALNNEMDDFTTDLEAPNLYGLIQGAGNLVAAGKRPLSSMSPTIITKNNETVLALGAQGGPRIISSVFQTWFRVINNKLDLDRAIQTPRVHHQFLPDVVYVDNYLSPDTKSGLEKLGHKVEVSWAAKVNGIQRDPAKKVLSGAFDARGEGAAGGI
ncbi:MAG: gamma-glutamyltransferase [Bdellovibrionaceae bacterium]|nr:gamma-glutamyltransferase [Pseudobdellovibrionaceae bacterium]